MTRGQIIAKALATLMEEERQLLGVPKLSHTDMATRCGSYQVAITRLLNPDTEPRESTIEPLKKYFGDRWDRAIAEAEGRKPKENRSGADGSRSGPTPEEILRRYSKAPPKAQLSAIRTLVGAGDGAVDIEILQKAIEFVCIAKEVHREGEELPVWTPQEMARHIVDLYRKMQNGQSPQEVKKEFLRLVKSA